MTLGRVEYRIDWGVCRELEAFVGWLPNTSNSGGGGRGR